MLVIKILPFPYNSMEGDFFMKIVVVDNPKFWSFFLRKMFKIKKLPQQPEIN